MKSFNKIISSFALVLWLYGNSVYAQPMSDYITELNYNTSVDYLNGASISFLHNSVSEDTFGVVNSTVSPASIVAVRGARVDGFHREGNNKYFSFDVDTRVNGTSVLKSDILYCANPALCSAGTFTYLFDALSENFEHINIDAFTLDPDNGDLIFSIESAAVIDGLSYLPADLIRFDFAGNYSLEYNSLSALDGLGSYRNIDAVSLLPNGYYLVSLADDGNYNGAFSYLNSDVLEYHPPTRSWSLAYIPLSVGASFNQVNISSLAGFENDLIFKNGFD